MRADVYRNLNKGKREKVRMWSIRPGPRVLTAAPRVLVEDVEFRVQPGSRETVRRTHKRSVHAYVVGEVTAYGPAVADRNGEWLRFSYDPYGPVAMFTVGDVPVVGAAHVRFDEDGAWLQGPRLAA